MSSKDTVTSSAPRTRPISAPAWAALGQCFGDDRVDLHGRSFRVSVGAGRAAGETAPGERGKPCPTPTI